MKSNSKEIDISTELKRTYTWPCGASVEVSEPQVLIVGDNGHRLVDGSGNGHYVPYGWIHLCWENRPGVAPIVY